jgi:hypothetical protein
LLLILYFIHFFLSFGYYGAFINSVAKTNHFLFTNISDIKNHKYSVIYVNSSGSSLSLSNTTFSNINSTEGNGR